MGSGRGRDLGRRRGSEEGSGKTGLGRRRSSGRRTGSSRKGSGRRRRSGKRRGSAQAGSEVQVGRSQVYRKRG